MTARTSQVVSYACSGGVARIRLVDAARGNPLSLPTVRALRAAVGRAREDAARVVVLNADGWAFCVGGDLRAVDGAEDAGSYVAELATVMHEAVLDLVTMPAVVVTAVQGAAAGAGFPLACCGDIVVASHEATFSLGHTRIGFTPDGGTTLLAATLGLHRLLQLALLDTRLSAAEAHRLGLVARLVQGTELRAAVEELVGSLLRGPAAALAASKLLLRTSQSNAIEAALAKETAAVAAAAASPDGEEGVRAFLEKRVANFA